MTSFDIVIVGAGMAGASLGAELAGSASVLLLEMEEQPGYHATGRSVAFWEESYGGPAVQPLTTASGPLMLRPDADLSDRPFLGPRGAIHIGRAESVPARDALLDTFGRSVGLKPLDADALRDRIKGLRHDWIIGVEEPSCADIDAAGLHQAYLGKLRRSGGKILTNAALLSAQRSGDGWLLETGNGAIHCGILINAAGAWADVVARSCGVAPVGITPFRRTVVQLRVDPAPSADLPVIMDLEGQFYFKPDGAGRIWLSPHDEAPSDPCDAAPEELAVAEAIERLQSAVDWRIAAVERKWAGLRSFAPDRLPVYGFDPLARGFFWFAGQGGFGIQTAPAAAKLAAALIMGAAPDPAVAGIDAALFDPGRFE
ncbi:NAD(P)/FAD-dependent oxidoreductase [Sphingobium phenoxybenzoativorans]|uniref:NAD(P)/FAD-dependent oxidoreductase n=1 Tax=Sphingobium phenoxybenzoativorans TaxID=1592790 RepID=UPI0008729861|nr:FAD-dependent oxidoreductase [Sphingobium phenoxybenzoativorans]